MAMLGVVDADDPRFTSWSDGYDSYFRDGGCTGWMTAHIVLMVSAWIVTMPLALVLSLARSRFHLPAQIAFHVLNGLGVFAGFVYKHATPGLYKGESHSALGWATTAATVAWTLLSAYVAYSDRKSKHRGDHTSTARYSTLGQYEGRTRTQPARWSGDSGMGSSRHESSESVNQKADEPASSDDGKEEHDEDEDNEEYSRRGILGSYRTDRGFSGHMHRLPMPRLSTLARGIQVVLEKLLLLLGFAALCTGFVVYGGLARSWEVLSIAAHFVKGGIFFWYGLLTLGRWMGAFCEFGWAWNIRPKQPLVASWKTRVPSAEFVESFVIFLYGASNVFLEHLNNAGGIWSTQDFEHVSITFLFFGGGLLGMLIDSTWIREMLSTSVVMQKNRDLRPTDASRFDSTTAPADVADQLWQEPNTYRLPLNPMPGLVIMILGIVMSAHKQKTSAATMLHSQWGILFFTFAIARAGTYLLLYLKPPTSHYPARPPTELVAAFCLASGGLLFMVSAHDTVWAVESNGLDAMIVFTVTMGFTGIILAWQLFCFAVKGWAVRYETRAAGDSPPRRLLA
ncbi:hypothetical protein LTR62_001626 [Meristemomyces frigidus]|uniref:Integral membrane protein n=1 Tax=Meristemomyces frigidus TaxID=1508187 RepID=A0AAN7TJN4_9PEZI|nr:hypothetical protein LTR62_001626 [Meristemomyces frigidus]